jgi:hypothetical protein
MADFSRRIAVALHGAEALVVAGATNTAPTLTELGKGQLPFTSVAVGFQLLGLSDWAGRLPLALWAALGLGATFLLVSRFTDRIAAAYSTAVLATMPLYFLQARTMLGDGVTLAATALATTGLAMSTFHPSLQRRRSRVAWGLLALLGLLAGFGARGVLLGVACPALGVGLAWLMCRLAGQACPSRSGEVSGLVSLSIGAAALALGSWVLLKGSPAAYLEVIGATLKESSKLPTHDSVLHQLGFGLFPWSAIAPFALALALRQPNDGAPPHVALSDRAPPHVALSDRAPPHVALCVCLASVFLVALALHGLTAPQTGPLPFVGTFAIAALMGVAFRAMEGQAKNTRLLALASAALLIIFYADLRSAPEQSLGPFGVAGAAFPESFAAEAKHWVKYGCLLCLGVMAVALGELRSDTAFRPLHPDSDYRRWLKWLQTAAHGRLFWLLAALTLVLGAASVLVLLASRGLNLPWVSSLGGWKRVVRYAFLVVPVVIVAPVPVWLARDALGAVLRWLPMPRARLALLGFAAFGLALSLGYYPALAAHLSPRNVFESFQEQAKPGEKLAVLGQAARVAPYYGGAEIHTPKSARAGLDWLLEAPAERRWLVLSAKDLGQVNQLYRQRLGPASNLPILDATSSEVLLASNRLSELEPNQNPLSNWVTNVRPKPDWPLDVDLSGQLRCLGWSITDPDGKPVAKVTTGQPYDFRIYWEVTTPVSGNWQTFIHIDGNRRRYNGDHDTLQGKYPFRFWQPGDFITDVHRFELEPHFSGATYQVYFGLFSGDKRLSVRSGKHHEDRIMGGNLVVH